MNKRYLLTGIILILLVIIVTGYEVGLSKKDRIEKGNLVIVGFSQLGAESDWRVANTKSIKEALTEENGFQLIYSDAQQKQENQINAIRNFIIQDVDIIIFSPLTESGWETVLREAKIAKIPVIIIDRMINITDSSLYTCWIGSDFEKEGIKAANWLIEYTNKYRQENKSYHIVVLKGTLDSTAERGRTKGFEETISGHPNLQILDAQCGEFTQTKGQEVMNSFLKQYEVIDVVVSQNDNMAFGAIDALKEAGKKPGKDVIIISFDAVKAALEAMIAGDMNVSIECNPLHGPKVADLTKKIMKGEKVMKYQYFEEGIFTAETAKAKIENRQY